MPLHVSRSLYQVLHVLKLTIILSNNSAEPLIFATQYIFECLRVYASSLRGDFSVQLR